MAPVRRPSVVREWPAPLLVFRGSVGTFFSSGDVEIKPVFRRETGDLVLFRYDRVQVLRAGPPPQAWVKTADEPTWRPNRGGGVLDLRSARDRVRRYRARQRRDIDEGIPQQLLPRLEGLDEFLHLIPEDFLDEIVRYRDRHWQLYGFFARCGPAALELSRSPNRALAFALANAWCFIRPVSWELRRVRSLLVRKRGHIAGALGFPPTRASVRVLAKVVPRSISVRPLLYLRDALNSSDPTRKCLAHVSRVNCGVIHLLTSRFAPYLSPPLLEDVGRMRSCDHSGQDIHRMVEDTWAMHRDLGRAFPILESHDHLMGLHDGSIDRIRARGPRVNCPFDPPPIEEIEGLQAIRDARTLWMEGDQMRHCVGSFKHDVLAGNVYVYRVLKGRGRKRCTLAIRRGRRGRWEIHELRARCNAPPGAAARAFVAAWLTHRTNPGRG